MVGRELYCLTSLLCCSANGQTYILAAGDANRAHSWISSLQEKRGEFIKVSSALEETALEQEKDRRTLKPQNKPVGALAITELQLEDTAQHSPTNVRKIVSSRIWSVTPPYSRTPLEQTQMKLSLHNHVTTNYC